MVNTEHSMRLSLDVHLENKEELIEFLNKIDGAINPSNGYESTGDLCEHSCSQKVWGEWWEPLLDKDSLEQTLEAIKGRIKSIILDHMKASFPKDTSNAAQ